jgi:[methyl-Co(III) methanol-specific corrinoid protein]:coenzyme M methyltransferase
VNSRERFLAALSGDTPDRPPVGHVAALTTVQLQDATGCSMPHVHHDPQQQVRLLAANHDVLGFDAVSFIINYFGEPAALGADIDWGGPTQLPTFRSHPWQQPEDATVPEDLLGRPPVSTYLQTLRIAKRDCGDRMAVLGKVMGPLSMTQAMCGVERVMMALIEEPDLIAHFMDVCVQVLVACANAQLEIGIDALAIGEGGAGANMLSPDMYQRLLLPVHQRMIRRIEGPTIMHICGDVTPRLSMFKQTAMTCFNFDWAIPPARIVEESDGAFRTMGNINTADLLNGTPDDIQRQVFENLDAGVDIISPGCAISPKCPNVNLRAIADAVEHYRPLGRDDRVGT